MVSHFPLPGGVRGRGWTPTRLHLLSVCLSCLVAEQAALRALSFSPGFVTLI